MGVTVSGTVAAEAYSNGDLYSLADPYNAAYEVYADGYEDVDPKSAAISYSTFQNACAGGVGTGGDALGGDYSTGGTASIAANGDWVCGGVSLTNPGPSGFDWAYQSFKG